MNCNALPGLNDDFKVSDIFESAVFDATWDVQGSLNYNDFGMFWRLSPRLYKFDDIEKILATYVNYELSNKEIPYFDATKIDSTKQQQIIIEVATKSSQNQKFVERALKQLYWSTIQGSIKTNTVLKPRDAVANYTGSKSGLTEVTDKIVNTGKEILDAGLDTAGAAAGIIKNLPTILIVGSILAVAYFGSQAIKNMKEIKGN